MKNIPKYLSYTKAWERINAAIERGFNLEAIAIEESIISDRLFSYILGVDPKAKISAKSGLGELISHWRKNGGTSIVDSDGTDLGVMAEAWRAKRNTAIHGLVKSTPGSSPMPPDDFLDMARQAALEGKALARKVQNWHKKILRHSKS